MAKKKKRCTKCGGPGPFHKDKRNRDGLIARCVRCVAVARKRRYATARGRAICAWHSLRRRADNKSGRHPAYVGIKVLMTREEFLHWAIPRYERWFKEKPGVVPSVDRRNGGHYAIDNIRLCSLAENVSSRCNVSRKYAKRGKLRCGRCTKYLPLAAFSISRDSRSGRQGTCRKCHIAYLRDYQAKEKHASNNKE